jgi:hypothetical protein
MIPLDGTSPLIDSSAVGANRRRPKKVHLECNLLVVADLKESAQRRDLSASDGSGQKAFLR